MDIQRIGRQRSARPNRTALAFVLFLFLSVRAHAETADVAGCLQTAQQSRDCGKLVFYFQRLPMTERVVQVPNLIGIMQRGVTDSSQNTEDALRTASYALTYTGSAASPYITTLLQFFYLDDEHQKFSKYARTVLATIGADAVPAVRQALDTGGPNVRINALQTLAMIRPESDDTIADMAHFLDDPDPAVSASARNALQSGLGVKAAMAVRTWQSQHPASPPPPAPVTASPDSTAGTLAADLIAQTKSGIPDQRANAIRALMNWIAGGKFAPQTVRGDEFDMSKAESAILDAVKDTDEQVRAVAILAISDLPSLSGNARAYYQDALYDSSEKVRARAIDGMIRLNPPDPGFERQLLDLLDKNLAAHPEEYANANSIDSEVNSAINALRRIGTPTSLDKATELDKEFRTRYAEKQRLDQEKAVAEKQREFDELMNWSPPWARNAIRFLFFLWFAVYIIRFPPTTKTRMVFWACIIALVLWLSHRTKDRLEEIQKNNATPTFQSVPGMTTHS